MFLTPEVLLQGTAAEKYKAQPLSGICPDGL